MILLLEIKTMGGKWKPKEILEEENIRLAIRNLKVRSEWYDWRIKRIEPSDVKWINTYIALHEEGPP